MPSNALPLRAKTDPPEPKQQVDAYNGLAPLPRATLDVLAVIYFRTARSGILKCLKQLFRHDVDIKRFTVGDLDPILAELIAKDLVEQEEIYYHCPILLADAVCRQLVETDRFDEIAAAVQRGLPFELPTNRYFSPDYDHLVREIRIETYRGNIDGVHNLLDYFEKHLSRHVSPENHPLVVIFDPTSFDNEWVRKHLPPEVQAKVARALIVHFQTAGLLPGPQMLAFFENLQASLAESADGEQIRSFLAEQLLLAGRPDAAERMVAADKGMAALLIPGVAAFLSGRNADAIARFAGALVQLKQTTRKRKIFFNGIYGLFYILALIKDGDPQRLAEAGNHATTAARLPHLKQQAAFGALAALIAARQGDPAAMETLNDWRVASLGVHPVDILVQCLVVYWNDPRRARKNLTLLKQEHARAIENGQAWLVAETAALLSRLKPRQTEYRQHSEDFFQQRGIASLVDLIEPESRWQQALNALMRLQAPGSRGAESEANSRLVWWLHLGRHDEDWSLSPREQVKNARGAWSRGRPIALKRLYHEIESFDYLTDQDKRICAALSEDRYRWRGYEQVSYDFAPEALLALAGHPLVFSADDPALQMEVVKERPQLLVSSQDSGSFQLAFARPLDAHQPVQIFRESPSRIRIVESDDAVRKIAQIVGKGITVPASGKKRLLEAVERVSPLVTVHSQIEDMGGSAQETPADPTPNIYLRPFGAGLKLDLWIQPLGHEGPRFRPGEGGETVIANLGGNLLRTRRDMALERQLAGQAVAACPTLATREKSGDAAWAWELVDPETCLEALTEIQALTPPVVIKWPEGERLKIRQQADLKNLSIRVAKQQNWFEVSGELKMDDGLVLSMERLLFLLQDSPGRFVRLEDGQFLALTRSFRKRLEELAVFSKQSGASRRFHPLAALWLDDLAPDLGGFRGDGHWKDHLRRYNDARTLKIDVPSTLQAELRDYQVEGFQWLARLAHWGVGACLADDMGLGKTLQALAVMLTTAARGPCLVIAPTSVCLNWEAEARRFAPSLRTVKLENGEREKIVQDLQPFDLLVVSYGLLQQEKVAQLLCARHFATIVLDEAQAIKNLATKRSQAAMELKADFRLITTGTPVENHLGELWNLFRFINPGLLGSLPAFNETFAVPIEKNQDRNARQRLKKLVQPYILRRTKSQVLDELPPRTDILLQVDLSPEESAFYEALRRNALERLAAEEGDSQGRHLRVLAEIMRLRQACCHPKLVSPEISLDSAKLALFGEIVEDLRANGHKALVFSQFTRHLDLIRQYLDGQSIRYQYLDGGTPPKERQARVNAFQQGEGDLFLISLKAGGLGLNLTAADYVIHMDPWWNPAVEDQASDRAHRIGQQRPVTVYRLIARHTIEEKIVALHRTKRGLADSLLEGADMSGKMTADELLQLIRES